ncbi:acylphosphatase [bacterium]|nr:acylphosphatase [bacterium]
MIRLRANFSGTVQGVGFRFTARRIAEQYEVTGFVKNLPNGRVEVVAEGDREVVENFIDSICSSLRDYIRNVEKHWEPATEEYKEFEIRF